MKDYNFQEKNDLYFSQYLNDNNIINDSYHFNNSYDKNSKNEYFDSKEQIKEKTNKNNLNKKKEVKIDQKRIKMLDELYLKNTIQLNNFLEDNYSIIEIEGNKNLKGIEKKNLPKEVKNNQSKWINMMPGLKYRNPELNKKYQKLNLTPIPYIPEISQIDKFQKNEIDKAKEKAIFIRKTEYTHALPPEIKKENIRRKHEKNNLINNNFILKKKARLIQKWYRMIKKNRNFNLKNEKIRLKNIIDNSDIYKYWEGQNKIDGIDFNYLYKNYQNSRLSIQIENSFSLTQNKIKYFDKNKIKCDNLIQIKFLGKPKRNIFKVKNNI